MEPLKRLSLLPLLLILLSGCQTLGLEQPKTLSDRIGYTRSTSTAAIVSATNALKAGTITAEEAQYVSEEGHALGDVLTAAESAISQGDTTTAEDRLKYAQSLLTSLQTYLSQHKVKP